MDITTTEKMLLDRFGGSPLLSTQQVAQILQRSPEGLRVTMSSSSPFATRLRSCKLKIGRRVYFRVASIARLIDES